MAMTKTGIAMSIGRAIPPGIGALRAANLTDDERKVLIKFYGLDDDAWLMARNAGRGIAGAIVGGIGGSMLGAGLGSAVGSLLRTKGGLLPAAFAGARIGGLLGAGLGTIDSTDKYSRGNAQRLIRKYY